MKKGIIQLTEIQANTIAKVYNGLPWNPMSGLWLVVVPRNDGTAVIFSDEATPTKQLLMPGRRS